MLKPPHPTTYLQMDILGEAVDLQWVPVRLLDDAYGKWNSEAREIQLRDTLNGLQCLDTLCHEIFHAISDRCNLELSEHQVHQLGMAWAMLFQDNPEFLGFVAERCTEEDQRRVERPQR